MAQGIETRHQQACRTHAGQRCNCKPAYRAQVYDRRERKTRRKSFTSIAEARAWRSEALLKIRAGQMSAATSPRFDEAVNGWLEAAEKGTVRTRGREAFRPGTIRSVRQAYRLRVKDEFGDLRLDQITRSMIQAFCDELDADGLAATTVEGSVLPMRLVYRWMKGKDWVGIDPTDGLTLKKATRGKRVPPAPDHAFKLLESAPAEDRCLWATAMLAGLRRGELMALRWQDVDLTRGTIRVEQSFDPTSVTFGPPKSKYGARTVPIPRKLAPHLREHRLASGVRKGLVFGVTDKVPFAASSVKKRTDKAWKAAKLERVTLHTCRHLYASMAIAAGVNAHALSRYMGHSSISVTFDLYGHLMKGNEDEAAALMDTYFDRLAEAT